MTEHTSAESLGPLIVATDFSPTATRALEWGIQMAAAMSAPLEIVHAVHDADKASNRNAAARKELEGLAEQARDAGVDAEWSLVSGEPWNALRDMEPAEGTATIVVGARGHNPWSRVYLGSAADRIIRSVQSRVLVVHPDDKVKPLRKIIVGFDYSPACEAALQAACSVASTGRSNVSIVLLHAVHPSDDFAVADESEGEQKQAEVEAVHRLETVAEPFRRAGFEIESVVKRGYPVEVMEQQAKEHGAGLVVVGTRARTGLSYLLLGSIAERIVHHMPCPVLAVHEPNRARSEPTECMADVPVASRQM